MVEMRTVTFGPEVGMVAIMRQFRGAGVTLIRARKHVGFKARLEWAAMPERWQLQYVGHELALTGLAEPGWQVRKKKELRF